MKIIHIRRILSVMLIVILTIAMTGCGEENSILGIWIYDTAERPAPDMAGVTMEIEKDVIHFSNSIKSSNSEPIEMKMDIKYEKDDETIYVLELSDGNETIDGESLEIPYTLSDGKLMLDMTEVGLGKVVMRRQ